MKRLTSELYGLTIILSIINAPEKEEMLSESITRKNGEDVSA